MSLHWRAVRQNPAFAVNQLYLERRDGDRLSVTSAAIQFLFAEPRARPVNVVDYSLRIWKSVFEVKPVGINGFE
jgi:hypothetical protein